jgi:hypothetical protein
MKCPRCSSENPEGGRFCQNCGHDFCPPAAVMPGRPKSAGFVPKTSSVVFGAMLLIAVIIGTFLLSPALLSSHSPERNIVIEPNSYYAVQFGFYGIGSLQYTTSQIAGPQIYLLELDKLNYDRFVSGKHYHYNGYMGIGTGGSGLSTEAGTIWVEYLVFVNDNPSSVTIRFGYDATVNFSLLVAGPLSAAALLVFLCAIIVTRRLGRNTVANEGRL